MYMYYLLGQKLMSLPISIERKEVVAQNTYLLALDGDIDFVPHAVHLLVDLMKRNRNLGAACGRIHPVGAGTQPPSCRFYLSIFSIIFLFVDRSDRLVPSIRVCHRPLAPEGDGTHDRLRAV